MTVLAQHAAICRLDPCDELPLWAQQGGFTALVRTSEELSVVCAEESIPGFVRAEKGWRIIKVSGPLEFSQVGVLAGIIQPLAQAGVSIFTISTYDTDYILVKETHLAQAVDTLRNAGHSIEIDDNI
jgi:hypothetical protein